MPKPKPGGLSGRTTSQNKRTCWTWISICELCDPCVFPTPLITPARMEYIEENMKLRRGEVTTEDTEDTSTDPYAELFEKSKKSKEKEDGNVTNSLAMLTAIPEVDLGMEYVVCSPHSRDRAD